MCGLLRDGSAVRRLAVAAVPPRNVVTFSNFSSAFVSSLISVYRLPFVNFLCVSAELWVILNTFVIKRNILQFFLWLSTTPFFPELIWPQNVYGFAMFRRNRRNAKGAWKVIQNNKVNDVYFHTEKLPSSSTLMIFLVYYHPLSVVLSWSVKSISSFPFPSSTLFKHLVNWSLCVVHSWAGSEMHPGKLPCCLWKGAGKLLMSLRLCHETLAHLARDTVWETLHYTKKKYGEAEVNGPFIIIVCVRWMAGFLESWIGGWLGPHVGEFKHYHPLM